MFTTISPSGAAIQGPTATLIYDDWYPALRTDVLRDGKMHKVMLMDLPLLVGRRKDGKVWAMRDACPHRGIPLSAGWYDGERVTCKYHGWEFEPCGGRCETIPSLSSFDNLDATKIYAQAFPCVERDGHAWVWACPARRSWRRSCRDVQVRRGAGCAGRAGGAAGGGRAITLSAIFS